MNERQLKAVCIGLAVLIVVALALLIGMVIRRSSGVPVETEAESTPAETTSAYRPIEAPEPSYNINIDPYREAVFTTDKRYLVLVNATHGYGRTVPEGLVSARTVSVYSFGDYRICEIALQALTAMCLEAESDGIRGIDITSAYRSYDKQASLFETYCDREQAKNPGLTRAQAAALVSRYSCPPGTSEHQTGLTVDLYDKNHMETRLEESFADTAVGIWLAKNASRFGFILRFPKDKTGITGIDFEPWHFRFVGYEAAKEMERLGLCLEEYVAYLDSESAG